MRLLLVRHLWGVTDHFSTAIARFTGMGYGAIESPLPAAADRDAFMSAISASRLRYRAMAFTGGATVADHVRSLREQLETARAMGAMAVTAHSGSDAWTLAQAAEFFKAAVEVEGEAGIPVAHETHRGRVMFNPWTTAELLGRFDRLRVCCDFSHWVVVAERLLDADDPAIALAASRCTHLHARVGYAQGPQVPDPFAPEYAAELTRHEQWWDRIWSAQRSAGVAETSLTPEFGPPPYLHTLPFTSAPVNDLQQVCDRMAARQKTRFENGAAGA